MAAPETWEGPWEGWQKAFRITPALLDQSNTVIQLPVVMSVGWRACPSSCLRRESWEPEEKEPHPGANQGYSPVSGLPDEGPAIARLPRQRTSFRGNRKVLGSPCHPHKGLPPRLLLVAGLPLRFEAHPEPHSDTKSPSRLPHPRKCTDSQRLVLRRLWEGAGPKPSHDREG